MGEEQLCTKCKQNPRASGDGTNGWCRECRAAYQRGYTSGRSKRDETKGFFRGVEAFRKLLVAEFARLGSGSFSGVEAATWIERAPGPRPE